MINSDVDIYCIMITKKSREYFIKTALENFVLQNYKKKKLIIINETNDYIVMKDDVSSVYNENKNIFEFHVNKTDQNFTLGKLRNTALELCVPEGSLWTTYDDDDWRNPSYLTNLYNELQKHQADIVFLKNRLEYNMNNKFVFKSQFRNGRAFFLARRYSKIKDVYDDVNTIEDVHIADKYRQYGKTNIRVYDNDAKQYIRVIHKDNTSIFVHPDKNQIVNYDSSYDYHEYEATEEEKKYVTSIIDAYF